MAKQQTKPTWSWSMVSLTGSVLLLYVSISILYMLSGNILPSVKVNLTPVVIEYTRSQVQTTNSSATTRLYTTASTQDKPEKHIELINLQPSQVLKTPKEITCNDNEYKCTVSPTKGNNPGEQADLAVFVAERLPQYPSKKYPNQLWVLKTWESQRSLSINTANWNGFFNYSFTFRRDSDRPSWWASQIIKRKTKLIRNFAKEKQANALEVPSAIWFVSNCNKDGIFKVTSGRFEYAKELAKTIQLSIFTLSTACKQKGGKLIETQSKLKKPFVKSFNLQPPSQKYHFYLSFENSLCKDYITEKFWKVLSSEYPLIPVVMGGLEMEEYESIAPPNSFIHVKNFTSPKHLATHLTYVAGHEEAFNYYHQWRNEYELEGPHVTELCKLCTLAHERPHKVWNNIGQHFNSKQCIDVSISEAYRKYYNMTAIQ